MLEPDDGKLSSPVLRGLSGRKAARLPGNYPETGFEDNYSVLPISSCGRSGRGERDGVSRAPSHRRIVARSGATATRAKASGYASRRRSADCSSEIAPA